MSEENDEIRTYGDVVEVIDGIFSNVAKELLALREFTRSMILENSLQYQEMDMLKRELEDRL